MKERPDSSNQLYVYKSRSLRIHGHERMERDPVHDHMNKHQAYWIRLYDFLGGEYPNVPGANAAPPILRSLMDAGVDCFIDLTEEWEPLDPYAPFLEGQEHLRFPIRDADVPRSRAEMKAILDAIDERLEAGKGVYVHCWGGIGRTGTVAGCWLARHGEENALQQLHLFWQHSIKAKMGIRSPETEEQCRYIREWKAGE